MINYNLKNNITIMEEIRTLTNVNESNMVSELHYLESYVIGRGKGSFNKPEDSKYIDVSSNNNVSRIHARIFFVRFDSDPNPKVNSNEQKEPYWAIEHLSQTSGIETVIFSDENFSNKEILRPGLKYKLPLNEKGTCGIYLGKITGNRLDGDVIEFGNFDTGEAFEIDKIDFSFLGTQEIQPYFKGEINGINVNTFSNQQYLLFDLLAKEGSEKNPVNTQRIIDVVYKDSVWEGVDYEKLKIRHEPDKKEEFKNLQGKLRGDKLALNKRLKKEVWPNGEYSPEVKQSKYRFFIEFNSK